MAIKITKAKDCAEPFPVDGFKCEHVEGVGKITYADSITALKGGLGSKHALKTCEYNINHKTKAGGWKDIPADCFKNSKKRHHEGHCSFVLHKGKRTTRRHQTSGIRRSACGSA